MRHTWKFLKVCVNASHQYLKLTSLRAEDEEPDYVDDDDEPINPLVDALFDEIETLRVRVSYIVPFDL